MVMAEIYVFFDWVVKLHVIFPKVRRCMIADVREMPMVRENRLFIA
jgi:hypothetical protein